MITETTVQDWAQAYRLAWEERDPTAVGALFTEDAEYKDIIYGDPHRGRDGVRAYWAGVTEGQEEVIVRMGRPLVAGNRAMVEFWTTMKSEGIPVTLAGCLLLAFDEDGLCRSLHEYWNFAEGTLDPPEVWGT